MVMYMAIGLNAPYRGECPECTERKINKLCGFPEVQSMKTVSLGWQASCFESQINLDPLAVDGLAEAFFNRAGKAHESTLTLRDFTQVLESRPELGESLQFGGLDLSAAMARQEVGEAVKPLPL
jgi:hypothetical protein